MAADFLANLGYKMGKYIFVENDNMPWKLRGIIRIDQCSLPSVRWNKL